MDLKIKDIVDQFQVSEKTVYRWIKEKKIPCYRIQHQYRFNRAEINEWILSNKIELSSRLLELGITERPTNFSDLLRNGGIYKDIPGSTVRDVLHNAIERIHIPASISKEDLIAALLNREDMMSTAIGNGIAIPHPRNPMITTITDASISICFLQQPLDFRALDGLPVHTLFILLTSSPRRHLEVLSKLSYLCQMDEFQKLLQQRAPTQEIIDYIQSKELEMSRKEPANK
jgi:nitrogen PTS system EIIA component